MKIEKLKQNLLIMTDICIFSILTDEIKAAVVCLVLKAHLVSEGSWHHVYLPG